MQLLIEYEYHYKAVGGGNHNSSPKMFDFLQWKDTEKTIIGNAH